MKKFKICKRCNKPIFRDRYEKNYVKETQLSVLTDYVWKSVKYHRKCVETKTKNCKNCGKEFVVSKHKFKQKYCSHFCASKANKKAIQKLKEYKRPKENRKNWHKKCLNCGKTFYRKRFKNGKLQAMTRFNKQKFCSYNCFQEHRRKYPEKYKR